jgi:DNA-binding MarR family transcriptional regulator
MPTQTGGLEHRQPAMELPDVLQFMQLLWAVVHGVEKTSKRMTSDIGVTGPQRLVLRVVGLSPGVSAGDVAAILHVHPSTLTGVLRRLIAHRLLARTHDPSDRRRAVLRLTARGARANAVRGGTVESAIAEVLEGVSVHDRTSTKRVLGRLATHLNGTTADAEARPTTASPAAGGKTTRGTLCARVARRTKTRARRMGVPAVRR